ncbi:MAG: BON domain-containing protein [Verrucomicrobiales bacterium]
MPACWLLALIQGVEKIEAGLQTRCENAVQGQLVDGAFDVKVTGRTAWVSGSVANDEDRRKVEALLSRVDGITEIQSDGLVVNPAGQQLPKSREEAGGAAMLAESSGDPPGFPKFVVEHDSEAPELARASGAANAFAAGIGQVAWVYDAILESASLRDLSGEDAAVAAAAKLGAEDPGTERVSATIPLSPEPAKAIDAPEAGAGDGLAGADVEPEAPKSEPAVALPPSSPLIEAGPASLEKTPAVAKAELASPLPNPEPKIASSPEKPPVASEPKITTTPKPATAAPTRPAPVVAANRTPAPARANPTAGGSAPNLTLKIKGGTVAASGAMPDTRTRQAVVAALRMIYRDRAIRDEMWVGKAVGSGKAMLDRLSRLPALHLPNQPATVMLGGSHVLVATEMKSKSAQDALRKRAAAAFPGSQYHLHASGSVLPETAMIDFVEKD